MAAASGAAGGRVEPVQALSKGCCHCELEDKLKSLSAGKSAFYILHALYVQGPQVSLHHDFIKQLYTVSFSLYALKGLERAAPPHLGTIHDRRLTVSKPSPPMRLAGLNPHRREATRSGRALGEGP